MHLDLSHFLLFFKSADILTSFETPTLMNVLGCINYIVIIYKPCVSKILSSNKVFYLIKWLLTLMQPQLSQMYVFISRTAIKP